MPGTSKAQPGFCSKKKQLYRYCIPLTQALSITQPLETTVVYIRETNKLRYCNNRKVKLKGLNKK